MRVLPLCRRAPLNRLAHFRPLSISASSTNAFPPPLSSVSGPPARLVPTGTTAEDLLSRVLGRTPTSHSAARLRASSDVSAPPFADSPLAGSQILNQSPNLSHMHPMADQHAQPNPVTRTPNMTSGSPNGQSSGRFNRTVGGVSFEPASHYRSASISGSTPHRQFRPPNALVQTEYSPGLSRALNPLGAIGSFPHHTSARDSHSSFHEHHEQYQGLTGPLLAPTHPFTRLAE